MTQATAANTYFQNKITFAKPVELTYMLYDGVVKYLKQSKLALDSNNIEKANQLLIKTQSILGELNNTLDFNIPISENLSSIYNYMIEKLTDANIRKETVIIDEVLVMAEDLRDTWKKAFNL
jgi:flagellar protein FliS